MPAAAALLIAVLVAGCVTPQPGQAPLTRAEAEAELAALPGFDFEGRAALRQGTEGTQATLSWQQQGDDARLRLAGPFGAGAVRVALQDGVLSIEDSQGTRLAGEDAEAALAMQVGFTPPLAMLRWWLLSLPAPGLEAQQVRDEAGRLASLQQDGWQVEYQEYRDAPLRQGKAALPRRLRATRDSLDLRLVIDHWRLGQ